MPDRWNDNELRELLTRAGREGFTLEQVRYADSQVRIWWETNRQKRDRWHLVVLNALRKGKRWGLEGFEEHCQRKGIRAQTPITAQRVEAIIRRRRERLAQHEGE